MRLTVSRHALLVAAALSGAGFSPSHAETAAAPAAAIVLPAITVTTVASRKLEDHVLASGLIAPVEQVSVVPLIEGQPIESLAADVGDTVTAGQVLATLSTATLTLQKSQLEASLASVMAAIAQSQASLTESETSAAEVKRTAARTALLFKSGSASLAANDAAQSAASSADARVAVATQGVASARSQVALVQAQLDNVTLQMSRAQVVAPVAGLITARNAQIGSVASAQGNALFVINRDGALELRADVAEADLPRVIQGQMATVALAADVRGLTGTLRLVEPDVDVTTRLGRARITLDKPELVRAGMYAEADILVAVHTAVAIPVTALGSDGALSTVMLVKDGVVRRTTVTTGIRDGGWIEILTGLAAGDTIVAKAGAFVTDGDKINPIPSTTN